MYSYLDTSFAGDEITAPTGAEAIPPPTGEKGCEEIDDEEEEEEGEEDAEVNVSELYASGFDTFVAFDVGICMITFSDLLADMSFLISLVMYTLIRSSNLARGTVSNPGDTRQAACWAQTLSW